MPRYGVIAALLLATCALPWLGCSGDKIADGAVDGARIYETACNRCHGSHGVPPPSMVMQLGVPDLTRPEMRARSRDEISKRIADGSSAKGMPAFGTALSKEQLEAITSHVISLSTEPRQ